MGMESVVMTVEPSRMPCFSNLIHCPEQYLEEDRDSAAVQRFKSNVDELADFLIMQQTRLNAMDRDLAAGDGAKGREVQNWAVVELEELFRDFQNIKFETMTGLYQTIKNSVSRQECRDYAGKSLRHLYLGSHFVRRAFEKPRGYAGDFEQILLLFHDEDYSLLSSYDRLISRFIKNGDLSIAHRNRVTYLVNTLSRMASEKKSRRLPFSFLSVGCGPAIEVQRFAARGPSGLCRGVLCDTYAETLLYCRESIARINPEMKLKYVPVQILDLLKRRFSDETYDLIYCAGLFDYLGDKLCSKILHNLYQMVNPGGALLFSNVAANRHAILMESVLEWFLIMRTEEEMAGLCDFTSPDLVTVEAETMHANLFATIRKEEISPQPVR